MPDVELPRFCQWHRDKNVLIVTLTRPDVGNALHGPANEELARVFDRFVADPDLAVAIVTGAGDTAFCHGAEAGAGPLPSSGFAGLTARMDCSKPVIAAVNGDAFAEGFELALACDIVVAAEDALFAMNQPRAGRVASASGIERLMRQVPAKRAMAALLTAKPFSAPEGVVLGFVNDLCGRNETVAVAMSWADRIMECDMPAVRATKKLAVAQHGPDSRARPSSPRAQGEGEPLVERSS